jgi:hypothetical protein
MYISPTNVARIEAIFFGEQGRSALLREDGDFDHIEWECTTICEGERVTFLAIYKEQILQMLVRISSIDSITFGETHATDRRAT